MSLPDLRADALQLFVFGPGYGELVAIRAPPNHWLIVDGCAVGAVPYAPRLLAHYGARPSLVVLTHPHQDHYSGLQQVIDDATVGVSESGWPVFGMVALPAADARDDRIGDLVAYAAHGGAEQVVSAIVDRWERHPPSKWTLQPGSARSLGEATVTALSPTVAMRGAAQANFEASRRFDSNDLSCALSVEWQGQRLVLGSDLVERPGRGWTEGLRVQGLLATHAVLKVPHHGSVQALHEPVLTRPVGAPEPTWLLSPFSRQNLPRFDLDGGLDRLLRHVPSVVASGLPRAHADQAGEPREARLDDLRPDGRHLRFDPQTPGFPDCFVVLEVAPDGAIQVTRGPGSVLIQR